MTSDQTSPTRAPAGRPVVLTPMPPGLWTVIAGAGLATLGPLFGFLVGSMIGVGSATDLADLDALSVSLMIGIIVGGVGVVMVLFGVQRLLRNRSPES